MGEGYAFVSSTCPECGAPTTARMTELKLHGRTVMTPGRRRCTALVSCGWAELEVPKVRTDRLPLSQDL
jgi:hypothetical protein